MKFFVLRRMPALLLLAPFAVATMCARAQDPSSGKLATGFECPESYPSDDARTAALKQFVEAYRTAYPSNMVRDLEVFRYRLLVAHGCTKTLAYVQAHVLPTTEILELGGQEYGPATREYDSQTKVWTVFLRHSGASAERSDADLIFNFYGWTLPRTAAAVAQAFVQTRQDAVILGKFQAPDDVTGQPAFFIVSETIYPDQVYGYVNVTKVAPLGGSSYAVTFAKRFTGASADDAARQGKAWFLSKEGQDMAAAVGRVGVGDGWRESLKY